MFQRVLIAIQDSGYPVEQVLTPLRALHPGLSSSVYSLDAGKPGHSIDGLLHASVDFGCDLLAIEGRDHSLARRVSMVAPCSVLMLPQEPLDFSRLLVPVDFSQSSADAINCAAQIAKGGKGECRFLTVESDDDPWLDWRDYPEQLHDRLRDFVRESAGGVVPKSDYIVEPLRQSADILHDGEVHAPPHAIEGNDVAGTIVRTARASGSKLLVMGTRGRTPTAAILLGSVTEKAMQVSPIPVLAVKRHGAQLSLIRGLFERLRRDQPSLVMS